MTWGEAYRVYCPSHSHGGGRGSAQPNKHNSHNFTPIPPALPQLRPFFSLWLSLQFDFSTSCEIYSTISRRPCSAPPRPLLQENWSSVSRRWERGRAHFRISRAIEMELNTLPPLLSSLPALFPHSSTLFPPLPGRVVCATLLSCLLLAQPSPGHVQWPPLSLPTLFSPQSRPTVFPLLGAIPGCSLQWESSRAALQLDPISWRQAGAGAASPSWSSSLAVGLLRQPRHGT